MGLSPTEPARSEQKEMETVGEGEDVTSLVDEANLSFLSTGKQDIF